MPKPVRRSTKPLFLEAAPRNLAFPPPTGKLHEQEKRATPLAAVEILVFTPNWPRTYPVPYRLASNKCTTETAVKIIEFHRTLGDKNGVEKNTWCKLLQKIVRACGLHTYPTLKNGVLKTEKWTLRRHEEFNTKDYHGPWDNKKLTLAGFKHDDYNSETSVENVCFDSLAIDVQRFPSVQIGDGLNLTRYVQYAVAHPEEDFLYPKDFAYLANRLGVIPPRPEHYDEATFARWKGRQIPSLSRRIITRQPRASESSSDIPTAPSTPPRNHSVEDIEDISPSQHSGSSRHFGYAPASDSTLTFSQLDWNSQPTQAMMHQPFLNVQVRATAQQ
jgi:hypothetical protein